MIFDSDYITEGLPERLEKDYDLAPFKWKGVGLYISKTITILVVPAISYNGVQGFYEWINTPATHFKALLYDCPLEHTLLKYFDKLPRYSLD